MFLPPNSAQDAAIWPLHAESAGTYRQSNSLSELHWLCVCASSMALCFIQGPSMLPNPQDTCGYQAENGSRGVDLIWGQLWDALANTELRLSTKSLKDNRYAESLQGKNECGWKLEVLTYLSKNLSTERWAPSIIQAEGSLNNYCSVEKKDKCKWLIKMWWKKCLISLILK